jgi:hypothetical protein
MRRIALVTAALAVAAVSATPALAAFTLSWTKHGHGSACTYSVTFRNWWSTPVYTIACVG